jgi:hypothetical protein
VVRSAALKRGMMLSMLGIGSKVAAGEREGRFLDAVPADA